MRCAFQICFLDGEGARRQIGTQWKLPSAAAVASSDSALLSTTPWGMKTAMEKSVASSVPKSEAKTSLRKSGASTTLSLVAEPEMIAEDDADDDAASTAVKEEEEEEEISGVSL